MKMKAQLSVALTLLALGACGAPSIPAPQVAEPPAPRSAARVVERPVGRHTQIDGVDASGATLWSAPFEDVRRWVAAGEGRAAVLGVARGDKVEALHFLDAHGAVQATIAGRHGGLQVKGGRVFTWQNEGGALVVQALSPEGAPLFGVRFPDAERDSPTVGARGDVAVTSGERVRHARPGGAIHEIDVATLHAAPGQLGLEGFRVTALAILDDGTLVSGAADGTVTAKSDGGGHRWSRGLRGAIDAIEADAEGAVVTTKLGELAGLGRDGRLRFRHRLAHGPLAAPLIDGEGRVITATDGAVFCVGKDGALLFAHAVPSVRSYDLPRLALEGTAITVSLEDAPTFRIPFEGPHPPPASLDAAFVLPFDRVLEAPISALLARGPDDVWAFHDHVSGFVRTTTLRRFDGRRWHPVKLPGSGPTEEYLEGHGQQAAYFGLDRLVRGADGAPWILGQRTSDTVASPPSWKIIGLPLLLTHDGRSFRDQRELFARSDVATAAPVAPLHGPATILCWGLRSRCAERLGSIWEALDAPNDSTPIELVARVGTSLFIGTQNALYQRRAGGWAEVFDPPIHVSAVGGTSERDVWVAPQQRRSLRHFDGATWTEVPSPLDDITDLLALAPDDVWATGADGVMHFDGKRFTRVLGAPIGIKVIDATGPHEIWLAGNRGVYRSRAPTASPPVRRWPRAALGADGALTPAPMGAAERSFRVERVSVRVDGGEPIQAPASISVGPEGVIWLRDHHGLVEVDERSLRARRLKTPPLMPTSRPMLVEGRGRGFLLTVEGVERLDKGRVIRAEPQLFAPVAVDGRAGALFAVSTGIDERAPRILARGPAGFELVTGAPDAAWIDVSVGPDGTPWLAGGSIASSDGFRAWPAGEGLRSAPPVTRRIAPPGSAA